MKKKNILLIINQLHSGGAEKVIASLSVELSKSYNTSLAIFTDLDKIDYKYEGELIKIALPYSTNTRNNNIFKRGIRFLYLVKRLRKIKKERNIDVSISFMEVPNIVNILSSKQEKTILSVRSYISREFADNQRLRIFRYFIKLLYNRSDCIIAPTNRIKTDLSDNFGVAGKKISVIHNFIDSELIEKLKREAIEPHILGILENYPVLANAGRITSAKGQWLLAGVLKKVKNTLPNVKLIILGDGPLRKKLTTQMEESGLNVYQEGTDKVVDISKLSNYDVFLIGFRKNPFPYLAKSQLFILSSVYEGFPNVIIEAMQCGLPVISSDCASGPREILSPNTNSSPSRQGPEYAEYGILTNVYDSHEEDQELYTDSTVKAVLNILTNQAKKQFYHEQSLKRAAGYEKNKIIQQWIQLIEN